MHLQVPARTVSLEAGPPGRMQHPSVLCTDLAFQPHAAGLRRRPGPPDVAVRAPHLADYKSQQHPQLVPPARPRRPPVGSSHGERAALGLSGVGRPVPRAGAGPAPRLLPPPPPRGVSRKWPYWIHSAAAARAERVPQPASPRRGPGAPRSTPARCAARHGGHRPGTHLGEARGARGRGRGCEAGCQYRATGPRTQGPRSQPREAGVSACRASRAVSSFSREEAKTWAALGRCEDRLVSKGEDPGRP